MGGHLGKTECAGRRYGNKNLRGTPVAGTGGAGVRTAHSIMLMFANSAAEGAALATRDFLAGSQRGCPREAAASLGSVGVRRLGIKGARWYFHERRRSVCFRVARD